MTITIKGNVTVSTLYNSTSSSGTNPHRAALGAIYSVIRRNITLHGFNGANVQNQIIGGTYVGFAATQGVQVRSCHGDPNLTVTINGVAYNSVEPQAAPGFQTGNVEKIWWDYGRNATTAHVPNPGVNMAAFVELDGVTYTQHGRLANLQNQTPWIVGGLGLPARIAMGAAPAALPEPDGPRVLYHMIGDFFIYSPNHYADGYIVVDDNNDLLQSRNFL